jgi:hypothetical protein
MYSAINRIEYILVSMQWLQVCGFADFNALCATRHDMIQTGKACMEASAARRSIKPSVGGGRAVQL